jgi:tetratricopeptide (TPR) repeat protein
MPGGERRYRWRRIVVAGALAALAWSAAYAKDSTASVKEAERYIVQGNPKAAEIELRNAIRDAPQDPVLHARLADVYLQEGNAASAEREARAARERNGNEADYLPVLADALLRQEKFGDLIDLAQPGNRDPVLESKVRTALGTAAWGLRDRAKAETLLDEAIELDPGAARPKMQLLRLLTGTKPAEADRLIDEAIAADPHSAEALQVKGEMLRRRGDQEGAMRLFDQTLKIDPKNISAHIRRADLNIALGKYKAADEDIDPILQAKRAGSRNAGTGVRHRGGRTDCRTHAGDHGTAGGTVRQGGGGRHLADQARRQEPDLPYPARDSPCRSTRLSRSGERVPRSSGNQPGPYRRHR